MKIALATDGFEESNKITEKFIDANYLLIADVDQQCICEVIEKNQEDKNNIEFAQIVVDRDCESVICGEIEKLPFEILANHGVTRSLGSGLTIMDALNCEALLELITDYIGGTGCSSSNPHKDSEGNCEGHCDLI